MIFKNKSGVEIIINPQNVFSIECEPYSLTITVLPIGSTLSAEILHFDSKEEYDNFKLEFLKKVLRY